MNQIKLFFQKILSFLHVHSIAGGLEISDEVLRLVYYNGKTWQMAAIRLAPGVLQRGTIKNADAFVASLRELKSKIPASKNPKKKMNVVVSLSSVNIYSQVFNLPILEGDELKSAIALNVQTLSPEDASLTYAGSQLLGRDEANLRYDVAAAFVERKLVDEMVQALFAGGFLTVGVESRSLALVRILREKGAGIDPNNSYLLLDIDNSGMDFLIVRKGKLYFEYSNQWTDIADAKGQISVDKFKETLEGSLRQVTNFYGQHWPEPLTAVILSASAFGDEAEAAIKEAASLPTIKLTLVMGQPISSEWLVALGCSLRGFQSNAHAEEINLSGEEAVATVREEQFLNFINFWRVVVPVVLAIVVGIFVFADNFLAYSITSIGDQSPVTAQSDQLAEIQALEASSSVFNQSVVLIQSTQSQQQSTNAIITQLDTLAAANQVTVDHISYPGAGSPIVLSALTSDENQITAFKNAVQSDPHFGPVTLPFSNIQLNNGTYSFSMTFSVSPSAFQG